MREYDHYADRRVRRVEEPRDVFSVGSDAESEQEEMRNGRGYHFFEITGQVFSIEVCDWVHHSAQVRMDDTRSVCSRSQ